MCYELLGRYTNSALINLFSNKSYFPFAFNLVSASIITMLYHASLNALPQERQNQNPYVNN